MAIQVEIDGVLHEMTKEQVFALAKKGKIGPKTRIVVNGTEAVAAKIKGVEFEESVSTPIETKPEPYSLQTPKAGSFPESESETIRCSQCQALVFRGTLQCFCGQVFDWDTKSGTGNIISLPAPPLQENPYIQPVRTQLGKTLAPETTSSKWVKVLLLDHKFEYFLTPVLLKVLWCLFVCLAYLTIVFVTLSLFNSAISYYFPGSQNSLESNPSYSSDSPSEATFLGLVVASALAGILFYVILIVLLAMILVAVRVLFEWLIVFFRVAEHLKSIDLNTKPKVIAE